VRARLSAARPGVALAASLVLPALAAVLGGLVHVSRCLPVGARAGQLGIHLALLRPATECPSGSLAVGGQPEQVLAVALVLTTPGVLADLLVLLGTLGAGRFVRRVLARLGRLAPWRRLPGRARVPGVVRVLVAVRRSVERSAAPHSGPLRRGPPRLALA
jgi:hypothetical protein